ncbi:MAG TPA: hypothetical protein VFC65_09095 [Prolixibacteraceae bacterium]|nr:hypothetical protein [Prolixibacteraceae bacterium]
MKKSVLTICVIFMITLVAMSQEPKEAFKPYGKPMIRVFSNFHSTFSDGDSQSAFEVTRVYLGYEHHFSEEFSGTVVYDVANPAAGKLEMTAFVKNAFLNYKHSNVSVDFGIIPTTQFKVQESFWGYRYLGKVFQDEYSFAASADLGTSVSYQFNNFVSADVAITNGEGYKKLQSDNIFKTAFGLTLNPVKSLTIRGMADFMDNQSTYAGFVGFKTNKFSLGAEYNYQKNHLMVAGTDYFGPSFYGTVIVSKKAKFFARYDDLQSNTPSGATEDWNIANDGQLFLAGFEYSPVSGIKLSPNYRGWNPAQSSQNFIFTLMLNCEIKF